MAARQALSLCEAELLRHTWNATHTPQGSADSRSGQPRISVVTTKAALRAAGVPPHIAARFRRRLRLIPEQQAER